eukprot:COSAG05_NODE_16835_length_337_cov_1.239496_1_plen_53_part_10
MAATHGDEEDTHTYVGKSQSCMVISGRLTTHGDEEDTHTCAIPGDEFRASASS